MAQNIWPRAVTLQFIELLQGEEALWNIRSPNYKLRNKKQDSIQNIILNMATLGFALDCEQVKKKINNLRSQFRKEYSKLCKQNKKSGMGADEIYTPSLW